jgi:hypothetical protein
MGEVGYAVPDTNVLFAIIKVRGTCGKDLRSFLRVDQ